GVRGLPAPETVKVAVNTLGGFRNSASLVLTGLDIEAKADLALRTVAGVDLQQAQSLSPTELAAASTFGVRELHVDLLRRNREDPATTADAQAELRLTVKAADPKAVGKAFTAPIVESALATYPGMFPTAPPAEGTPYGVYWPTTVPAALVTQTVTLDGDVVATTPSGTRVTAQMLVEEAASTSIWAVTRGLQEGGAGVRAALGTFVGARSGDKGGNANVGLWVRRSGDDQVDHDRYAWLVQLVDDDFSALLPESAHLETQVFALPNLLAVNVVIRGWLGRGVADSTSLDPQAKGLGEHLRARIVQIPESLLREDIS
ncbi:MAG: acyclic terpene utilization AtuA family protein, partial [Candidatus Nanopelagicales bacterium]